MTNPVPLSPWRDLPTESLYILPEDLKSIQHHRNFSNLRLETLPDQFVGGLDTAEVVFLALNPGFHESDITVNLQLPEFLEANHNNRNDPYGSPFYYFGGGLAQTGGYKWWARILNSLLQEGVTEAALRQKIMLIEYFPYHSPDWKKSLPLVPSQQFAFDLVREAIDRKKTIVIMRSEKLWRKAVPELATYKYMLVKNLRRPFISPNNLGDENFKAILAKLI